MDQSTVAYKNQKVNSLQGAKPAIQKRSRAVRDELIDCGIDLLNEMYLDDLTIPLLTGKAGCSVGNFYKRFENHAFVFGRNKFYFLFSNILNLMAKVLGPGYAFKGMHITD